MKKGICVEPTSSETLGLTTLQGSPALLALTETFRT